MSWSAALLIGVCVLIVVAFFRRAMRLRMEWRNATEQIVKLRQDSAAYAELKAQLLTSASAAQTVVLNTGIVEGSLDVGGEPFQRTLSGSTDEQRQLRGDVVRNRLVDGFDLVQPVEIERIED